MTSLILVTDATSFVSSHIIKQLQDEGHQVRGTVVSVQEEEERIKSLQELSPEAKYKLEVVEADPTKSDSWENALKEVNFVIHGVKPAAAQPAAAEGEAPIQPAVEAVLNVFKASMAAKSVKRIILTSSYQAIAAAPTPATDKVYTEADWADAETADPLIKSLILAEKAAWDFVKELTDADKIELSVINPTLPLGPALLEVQQDVVKLLMDRGINGCPRVSYSCVDVRDVAAAHIKALTLDDVASNRHIVHGANLWMREIAQALAKEFKPQGYNVPTLGLPNVALWGLSLFNKTAKTFLPVVGKQSQFDNARMKDVLGITPKDVKESVVEEAQVLIDRGLVKKSKKVKNNQGASAAAAAGEGEAKVEEEGEKKEGEKKEGEKKEATEGEEKPTENGEVKEDAKEEEKKEEGGDAPAPEKEEKKEETETKPAEAEPEEKPSEEKKEEAAAPTEEAKAEN